MRLWICLVLSIMVGPQAFGVPNLFTSRHLLETSAPNTAVLVVKYKDSVPHDKIQAERSILPCTDCEVQPLLVSSVFPRSPAEYERERVEYRALDSSHLENYKYFVFPVPLSVGQGHAILENLFSDPLVEFAYFEPTPELATFETPAPLQVEEEDIDLQTTDYEYKQFYLNAAPEGVDARYAWELPGGTGEFARVIDLELGWDLKHEDFSSPFFVSDQNIEISDHGTAVVGEIAARRDGKGVTGIAHASAFGVSRVRAPKNDAEIEDFIHRMVPAALDVAVSQLKAGDVLIIELHAPGPDNGKYTAMEYFPAVFDVVKLATSKGVLVLAAAGNGGSNFDSPKYEGAFDRTIRDSGAILVGAGAAPGGSHLSRMSFSNYGVRVDAFAYGEKVTTTGYGDLSSKTNATYTQRFSGTSSATPIVTGVAAVLTSMKKAKGQTLTPEELRSALRATGTKQKGDLSRPIGTQPNLKELISYLGLAN